MAQLLTARRRKFRRVKAAIPAGDCRSLSKVSACSAAKRAMRASGLIDCISLRA
ncbi:MAG: hypothetical protein V1929_08190 [bacterium]